MYHMIARHRLFLTALLLGVVITTYVSWRQSIWLDEGLSIEFSQRSLDEIITLTQTADLHPPLYYFLLHASGVIFGSHVFVYRLWSLVFYILFVIIFYRFLLYKGWGKVSSQRAISILFLFLLCPFVIYYASEIRSYMAVIFLSLLQFVAFDRLCEGKTGWKQAAVYVMSSVIGLYTFYPIGFLLLGELVYVVWRRREQWWHFFWLWVVMTVAYAPWLWSVVLARVGEQPGHFLPIPWWQIPAILFVGFAGGRVTITDMHHVHDYWPTIIVGLAYGVNLAGLWWWRKRKDVHDESVLRALIIGSVIVFIGLMISVFRFSVFDPRYYAELFPLFMIVFVYANYLWWQKGSNFGQIVSGVVVASNVVILLLYLFNPWYAREPWKTVVPQVEQELQAHDAVVFIGGQQPPPTYRQYQKKEVEIVSTYPDSLKDINDFDHIREHVGQSLADNNRVWYAQFLEWQKDPEKKIRRVIEEEFVYRKTIGFFKVQFDLYERK